MLNNHLNFNTPEEGRAKIKELRELQSLMVGSLYPEVLEDTISQIEEKINKMLNGQCSESNQLVKDYPSYLDLPKGSRNDSKPIDWEQRRYEIAKESVIAIMSNEDFYHQVLCEGAEHGQRQIQTNIAHAAVIFADALIEELKK